MIHGDINGRAADTGGRLSREGEFGVGGCVELATRPVIVVVSSVGGGGGIRQPLCHHGRLSQLFIVEIILPRELRYPLRAQLAAVGGHSNLKKLCNNHCTK